MTINAQSGKVPEAFSTAYFNALIGALADSSDAPWKIVAGPDEAVAGEQPDPIRLKLKFEGSLQGEALLEFDRTEAEMLAQFLPAYERDFPSGDDGIRRKRPGAA